MSNSGNYIIKTRYKRAVADLFSWQGSDPSMYFARYFARTFILLPRPWSVVRLGSGIKAPDANRLNKLIRKEGLSLEFVSERRMMSQPLTIMDNMSPRPWHGCWNEEPLQQKACPASVQKVALKTVIRAYCHKTVQCFHHLQWHYGLELELFQHQVLTKYDSASFQWQVIFQTPRGG